MAYFDIDRRKQGQIPGGGNVSGSIGFPPGEKAVSEYQVSGFPFVSGSTSHTSGVFEITFPTMTQWVLVSNESDTDMRIGFTAVGIAANQYYTVQADTQTDKFDIRTKSLFVKPGAHSKTYSVMAGLTAIPTGSIADLSANVYWGV
tara:strand:+ start:17298 stop:17735 length:438 start_codon:yes stop_codon:yes gene_type:complete